MNNPRFLCVGSAFFLMMGTFLGCGAERSIPVPDAQSPGIPSLGNWELIYEENFDTDSLRKNWRHLRGPTFDALVELGQFPEGWTTSGHSLRGKSIGVIVLQAAKLFTGDLDIQMRFSHPLRHRKWSIAIGGERITDGYLLMGDRSVLKLCKLSLTNVVWSSDLTSAIGTETTSVRLHKEGARVDVYVNDALVISFLDYAPPMMAGGYRVSIGCEESAIEIEQFEVRGRISRDENPAAARLDDDYHGGYAMTFIDDYNQLNASLPVEHRDRFEQMLLHAAFAVRSAPVLRDAPERFPELPPSLLTFMKLAGALQQDDSGPYRALLDAGMPADTDFLVNLRSLLHLALEDDARQQVGGRMAWVHETMKRLQEINPNLLAPHFIEAAYVAVAHGDSEHFNEIVRLLETHPPNAPDLIQNVLLLRCAGAKYFRDTEAFRASVMAAEQTTWADTQFLAWIYLKNGEWAREEGDTAKALAWFDTVAQRFPQARDAWAWAQVHRATLQTGSPLQGNRSDELSAIDTGTMEPYQKQASLMARLLRRAESSSERKHRLFAIYEQDGIRNITASSVEDGLDGPEALVDGSLETRWGSRPGVDLSWLIIEFKAPRNLNGVKIFWERAAAREYEILLSNDGLSWFKAASEDSGQEAATRLFLFEPTRARFVKILMKSRATAWGYSIWEIVFL